MPPRASAGQRPGRQSVEREGRELAELERRLRSLPPHAHQLSLGDALAANAGGGPGATPQPGARPTPAPRSAAKDAYWTARRFDELPLSERTLRGLRESNFTTLTAIQRAALPQALAGRDVLGAAKTGSGKTLAFVVPVLELLHRRRWGRFDGLGALVLTPTRELALQIFDTLRRVGRHHDLSAGVLIGGHDVREEKAVVARLNVLVATPGRLLQHMDETAGFGADELQVLVLDEADRCLDLGFRASLDAILDNLPRGSRRQTLLFSATQTKSVRALARLSLREPEHVWAHAEAAAPTPAKLRQAWMRCDLADKTDTVWTFVKTHLKTRTIIFFSTCKQVRFYYETFRRLRPGVPLSALHGHLSQKKRAAVFAAFNQSRAAVLLATDVAARGLDFPDVDWVLQADAPEDAQTYIHRVGRTARYTNAGRGLLLVAPSEEEALLARLERAKIQLAPVKPNPERRQSVGPALAALLSKDAELKALAQRACVSYVRSVFLQPDKEVFDVQKLPVGDYALSMGLPVAPKLGFVKKTKGDAAGSGVAAPGASSDDVVANGSALRDAASDGEASFSDKEVSDKEASSSDDEASSSDKEASSSDKEASSSDDDAPFEAPPRKLSLDQASSSDEELFQPASRTRAADPRPAAPGAPLDEAVVLPASNKRKRMKIRQDRPSGTRVVFDEEGAAKNPLQALGDEEEDGVGERDPSMLKESVERRAHRLREIMRQRDAVDRAELKARRKEDRVQKRAKRLAREAEEGVAVLAGASDESDEGGSESDGPDLLASDSDDEPMIPTSLKVKKEAAHMDMLPAAKESKAAMSLAEQEALALSLLKKSKR